MEQLPVLICENDMLQNGNSGLKMGVSRVAHTQYAYIWKHPLPPPPPLPRDEAAVCAMYHHLQKFKTTLNIGVYPC